ITTQTLELVLDAFPRTVINVPLPPLQTVDSIAYIDPDGQTQTLDPQTYDVDAVGGRVAPAYGEAFPATRAVQNAVTVRFTAGYTSVPEPIRAAMLLIIGDLYANREGQQDVRLYGN